MAFKSEHQPYCRQCGKAIAKKTETVWPRREPPTSTLFGRHVIVDTWPEDKAACQRLVNEKVMAIKYHNVFQNGEVVGREIWWFSTWDGVSYVDLFFCKGPCATAFAYMVANDRPNLISARAFLEKGRRLKASNAKLDEAKP